MADKYDITGITRTVNLAPGSADRYVYEVGFVTKPHGAVGVLQVPLTTFSPDAVALAVAAEADKLEATFDL